LEDKLSETTGPRRAAARLRWVKRALRSVVERRQDAVKAREVVLKVYAEHLAGVQKILKSAAGEMSRAAAESAKREGSASSPPQKPSTSKA